MQEVSLGLEEDALVFLTGGETCLVSFFFFEDEGLTLVTSEARASEAFNEFWREVLSFSISASKSKVMWKVSPLEYLDLNFLKSI